MSALTSQNSVPLFSAESANRGIDLVSPVARVVGSHWYVLGEEVAAFEREFAAYCGAGECVGLANGTDALEMALRGLGLGYGDRVCLAANAGFYGSTAVHAVGATPVYVDVEPERLTLDPAAVAVALQIERPAAIIVTHLYGQLAAIEDIVALADAAGVPVIEDCAQAHGAERGGRRAGSFGKVGCFSFYPTKNLGALGDGGGLVSSDATLIGRVRQLRQYGWGGKYSVDLPGGRNSRLDEMQAAILREKLPRLDGWNEARRLVAKRYNTAFAGLPLHCPPSVGKDYVAHLYVIRLPRREALRTSLRAVGVASDVHYPVPDHRQSAYPQPGEHAGLPVTEQAGEQVLTLPCFPGMTQEQIGRVVDAVLAHFSGEAP